MNEKDKRLEIDAILQRMKANRAKRLAKKPLPDMYFHVKTGANVTILGPRGGLRDIYVTPEPFFFHLDQVIKVDLSPRGAEIIFESSPPWENTAVRVADVEIKAPAEWEAFHEEWKSRGREQNE
jgi:hypothetical protein